MNKQRLRISSKLVAICLFPGWWLPIQNAGAESESLPNPVLIYADDLGYGDVPCYNSELGKIETPNIDRLAPAGMLFTDGHSSSGCCSTSRYTLLTGRYHWRSGLQRGIVSLWESPLIPPARLTIGGLAKRNGYRTTCIGKWHLGWDWRTPEETKKLVTTSRSERRKAMTATDEHQAASRNVFSRPIPGGPTAVGFNRKCVAGPDLESKGISQSHPLQLYHLGDDGSETQNLASQNPERVQQMEALLEKLIDDRQSNPGKVQPNDVEVVRHPSAPKKQAATPPGAKDLVTPEMTLEEPAAGRRVRQVAPEYEGTEVYHALYLPTDWMPGGNYPVIVEYTGNYFPKSGSTGEVKDANLGYGLSGGEGFIWVSMPYIQEGGKENALTWWGDTEATVEYCKTNLPRICEQFGGDLENVFICGFSRGAIAASYIGLADDEIAAFWKGMFTHDHFDGQKTWNYPESDRASALVRLARLKGRPVLVSGGSSSFLKEHLELADFSFLTVPVEEIFDIPEGKIIHRHTDLWMHRDSAYRDRVRRWLEEIVAPPESGRK